MGKSLKKPVKQLVENKQNAAQTISVRQKYFFYKILSLYRSKVNSELLISTECIVLMA